MRSCNLNYKWYTNKYRVLSLSRAASVPASNQPSWTYVHIICDKKNPLIDQLLPYRTDSVPYRNCKLAVFAIVTDKSPVPTEKSKESIPIVRVVVHTVRNPDPMWLWERVLPTNHPQTNQPTTKHRPMLCSQWSLIIGFHLTISSYIIILAWMNCYHVYYVTTVKATSLSPILIDYAMPSLKNIAWFCSTEFLAERDVCFYLIGEKTSLFLVNLLAWTCFK